MRGLEDHPFSISSSPPSPICNFPSILQYFAKHPNMEANMITMVTLHSISSSAQHVTLQIKNWMKEKGMSKHLPVWLNKMVLA
jgi:hypothetical protein